MTTGCFPVSKQQKISAAEMKEYEMALATMKRRQMNCIAMMHLTQETIYKVSLVTFSEAVKKLKKIVSQGNSVTPRMLADYEASKGKYEFAALQVDLKMHPSKASSIIAMMHKKMALGVVEKKDSVVRTAKKESKEWPMGNGKVVVSKEIFV